MIEFRKTDKTPEIIFNPEKSTISIEGKCVPENAREFFTDVFNALEEFAKQSNGLTLDINLDYFNTSSSKKILDLLFEIRNKDKYNFNSTRIIWRYFEDDNEMLESGQMFEEIIGTKFEFQSIPLN